MLERSVGAAISVRATVCYRYSTVQYCTGKKTPGGAGTHTGHSGARGQTDHTDEPHNRPPKPKDTNP